MRQPCIVSRHPGKCSAMLCGASPVSFPITLGQCDVCRAAIGSRWATYACGSCRFGDAAAGVFGSGWAWLQVDPSSKDLAISTTSEFSCCQTVHTAWLQRFDCSALQLHSLPSTRSPQWHCY